MVNKIIERKSNGCHRVMIQRHSHESTLQLIATDLRKKKSESKLILLSNYIYLLVISTNNFDLHILILFDRQLTRRTLNTRNVKELEI